MGRSLKAVGAATMMATACMIPMVATEAAAEPYCTAWTQVTGTAHAYLPDGSGKFDKSMGFWLETRDCRGNYQVQIGVANYVATGKSDVAVAMKSYSRDEDHEYDLGPAWHPSVPAGTTVRLFYGTISDLDVIYYARFHISYPKTHYYGKTGFIKVP